LIDKLEWDSKFFGRKIGRLTKALPENVLVKRIRKAQKDNYSYLTFRFNLGKMSEIQILENHGFYLTDIGIVWERKIHHSPIHPFTSTSRGHSPSMIREATINDAPALKTMAKGLFTCSRFYNDPFFSKMQADKVYQAWVENSLKDRAVKVFVAGESGFITCKILSKTQGSIPLVGVAKKARGRGIGTNLTYKALKWFGENKIKTIMVRTQLNNIKAMDFYKGLGFRIKRLDVTMGRILNHDA